MQTTKDLTVTVQGTGGHSMMPPSSEISAVPRLARIIDQLESQKPSPRLVHPTDQMLKALAHMTSSIALRLILSNADVW